MKATLIVNPNAGGTNEASQAELVDLLGEAGIEAVPAETQSEEDLEGVLAQKPELVIAAGGDGTIRAVVTRMAGKGIPLGIVPLGTANNIGNSLGVSGKPASYLPGMKQIRKQKFDVGVVQAPWGKEYFLEGAGLGLFAHTLTNYDPEEGKSPLRAIGATVQTLREFEATAFKVWLDGELMHDEIVLMEIMNTPAIGPRLRLAPEADPSDGMLDVVMINPDQKVGFTSYVSGFIQGQLGELPNVNIHRCRKLAIEWDGSPFHLDAEIRQSEQPGRIEVEVWPQALELWLPSDPTPTAQ